MKCAKASSWHDGRFFRHDCEVLLHRVAEHFIFGFPRVSGFQRSRQDNLRRIESRKLPVLAVARFAKQGAIADTYQLRAGKRIAGERLEFHELFSLENLGAGPDGNDRVHRANGGGPA